MKLHREIPQLLFADTSIGMKMQQKENQNPKFHSISEKQHHPLKDNSNNEFKSIFVEHIVLVTVYEINKNLCFCEKSESKDKDAGARAEQDKIQGKEHL